MNSLVESKVQIHVTEKMLKEFNYLFLEHGPKMSCGIILKNYLEGFDLNLINDIQMKEQAICYYIEGPAWRYDDFLLQRSWFKGFESACAVAGKNFSLSFTIDQYCVSKLQTALLPNEE